MAQVRILVDLPESLVERANTLGLHIERDSQQLLELIERQIQRLEAAEEIRRMAEALHAQPDKPTPEEIEEEIRAYWEEQKIQHEGSGE
jgi:hypothetical protein